MKIKRFTGRDMRDTMRQVRENLGPDAVILDTTRDGNSIAISAAVDFDPGAYQAAQAAEKAQAAASLARGPRIDCTDEEAVTPAPAIVTGASASEVAEMRSEVKAMRELLETQLSRLIWDDHARRDPKNADVMRHLTTLGVSPDMVQTLVSQLDPNEDIKPWSATLKLLVDNIDVADDDLVCNGGIYAVVGPTGAGKTTTIAKLAARYIQQGRSEDIALVTTDTFRIAAREQLETFGRIIGVPVYSASDAESLGATLRALADKELVLIDTAGMGQRDLRLARELACLTGTEQDIRVLLALPANVQTESLQEIVDAFLIARPSGCILTKMDEATSLGGALSVLIRNGLPLTYVANGQRVPEDLHSAHSRQTWLVKAAVELIRRRQQPTNDDYMADNFAEELADACA